MGVLSDALTQYRSVLVSGASLVNLKENWESDDLPASALHQVFVLRLSSPPVVVREHLHGGGVVEYSAGLELEIHWDPEVDTEAIHNTIADDCTAAVNEMITVSNRSSGVQIVHSVGGGGVERVDVNDIMATLNFEIIFRETVDVS